MRFVLIILAAVIVSACADPNQEKIDSLKAEAIAVHDEVMPQMGLIADLKGTLKKQWQEAKKDTTGMGDSLTPILAAHITMLDSADEAMMSWMADYDPTYAKHHSSDSAIVYYGSEGEKITEVKLLMEKAIEDAERLVDNSK